MTIEVFRPFMRELALAGATAILPWYRKKSLEVVQKADESPVTRADRDAEEVMRRMIEKRYPHHGIIGEEFGNLQENAEWVWVLDPIDGTKSFITGVPLFGTLIALLHEGRPVLGAIHQPVLRQYLEGDGRRALLDGAPVTVRPCAGIPEATLLTSDPVNPARYQNGAAFDALANRVRLYRTFGDCYGYLLLAGGWADIMVDPVMKPWDYLPLIPIVEGAGGVITDWQGKSAAHTHATSIVAATPSLHGEVIRMLNPGA